LGEAWTFLFLFLLLLWRFLFDGFVFVFRVTSCRASFRVRLSLSLEDGHLHGEGALEVRPFVTELRGGGWEDASRGQRRDGRTRL
jgi:hypothetical protein